MIKVLHFVTIMNRGGQETFIMNMYRNIDRSKVAFGFLCSGEGKGDYDEEILSLGGKIHHVKLDNGTSKSRHIRNYKTLKKSFSELSKQYDIVHIHNYHAFDMSRDAKAALTAGFKKVVVHSHNASADGHLKLHMIFKKIISDLKVTRLACSEDAGKWMYTNDDFTVINNGIPVKSFEYNEEERKRVRDELEIQDKFVIGHVGRFFPQKNHQWIVKVFAEYSKRNAKAVLLLIGNGELFSDIKQMVKDLDIAEKVYFLGVREDTAALYSAMDMFFMPSIFEGLGIVGVEAQVSGLPCLMTDSLPLELNLTDRVYRASLEKSETYWANEIERIEQLVRTTKRKNQSDIIKQKGFDAFENALELQSIYLGTNTNSAD